MCVYIYIYIYILCVCIYIYIYIYTYPDLLSCLIASKPALSLISSRTGLLPKALLKRRCWNPNLQSPFATSPYRNPETRTPICHALL